MRAAEKGSQGNSRGTGRAPHSSAQARRNGGKLNWCGEKYIIAEYFTFEQAAPRSAYESVLFGVVLRGLPFTLSFYL